MTRELETTIAPVVDAFEALRVDYYLAGSVISSLSEFDRSAMSRRRRDSLVPDDPTREFSIASAEDVVLHKLRWFRDGGEVSDRQWSDILGVVRVQSHSLDLVHIRRWAVQLGVADLFERAWTSVAEAR